ncbi:DUF3224 domain-containing protein [Kitasatospora sp. NPDC057692]|uniref:DUF3224 domain-containing protein n=1 Tax=Kitasatospora sp. NPDC057692 TaxID=3346215 RepID=UPI0036CDA254
MGRARACVRPGRPGRTGARGAFAEGTVRRGAGQAGGDGRAAGVDVGRVRISKEFTGGPTGSSVVRMPSVLDGASGPAAYVAVERVTGSPAGRQGSFALRHAAPGSHGERPAIRVVEGTGSGGPEGITGVFEPEVDEEGWHGHVLDYALNR